MEDMLKPDMPMEQGVPAEIPQETAPTEPVVQPNVQSNDESIALINKFSPGADTSTPEAIIAAQLQVLKTLSPIYDKLYDVALSAPEAAAFVKDLLETGDVVKSLARNYDPEEIQAAMEEIESSDYEEDKTAYAGKVSQIKERGDMVKKNMDISFNDISEFMEERKDWPEEKAQAFENFIIKHYDDGKDGLITKADLALLEKGFNYDGDVAEAEENGKVMGRNEQISTKKASKEDLAALLPEASAGIVKKPEVKQKPKTFAQKFMEGI